MIVEGDNVPLSPVDGLSSQRINGEIVVSSNTEDQVHLTDMCSVFLSGAAEYMFFSGMCGALSRMDQKLGSGTCLDQFGKIETISTVFPRQNGMKLEISSRRKMGNLQMSGKWNAHSWTANQSGKKSTGRYECILR